MSRELIKLINMEKLTSPLDIAEDIVKIELPEVEYNNNTQTRFDVINPILAVTYNATQTFYNGGKPRDSDNDQ